MHAEEYRCRGKEVVDYITEYLTKIREKRVYPDVQPGYMRDLLPENAPTDAEDWETIFQDFETVVMPGMVHWQSPHMHAYFPALTSWPSLLGDMLADAINCLGFTWASSPACTELEMNVVDWLCKALGLPSYFLHYHPESKGGGILQSTVSECTLVSLLAARNDKILHLKELEADVDDSVINSRLIAYASDQAHSSVEKAGLISLVKIRFLPTDENFSLRGETLQAAIEEDKKRGLIPVMGGNTLTQELLQRLTKSGAMFLIPAAIHTKLIVRFTVTSQFTTQEDILRDWAIIQQTAATVLARDSIRQMEL
uniref:Histidine decarboxylase n=1 Tax=Denticeps clupeoides TaxID=299321 RepID=A0AAY4DVF5_9TELE